MMTGMKWRVYVTNRSRSKFRVLICVVIKSREEGFDRRMKLQTTDNTVS